MNIDFTNILSSGAHSAVDTGAASVSALGTLALASGMAPVPDGIPAWIPYATTILGPILLVVVRRLFSAKAAQERSLAASKERRAKELLADNNPTNDAEAAKLQDEADALKAKADALDAARKVGE